MRPLHAAALTLTLLLAAPLAAAVATPEAGPELEVGPCATVYLIHPGPSVDPGTSGCYTTWVFDTADQLIGDGAALLQWLRDLVDWIECVQEGGGIDCDSPPTPWDADTASSSAAVLPDVPLEEDVGPCATVYLIHPGPSVDPGSSSCYRAWAFDVAGAYVVYAGDLLDWIESVVEYYECGGSTECNPPQAPPALPGVAVDANE